jgi:O-antigen ligase
MANPMQPPADLAAWPKPLGRPRPAAPWDLLLVCVGVYVATAVGRMHEVFPVLLVLKPALVAAVLGVGLWLLQQSGPRRAGLLRSPTLTCLVGLVAWSAMSVPAALNQGAAFQGWIDFVTTVVMCLVLAGSARGVRDVERLAFVYFAVTVVYAAVVLSRFETGGGATDWRLSRLYYYDANDMATLIVSALPIGLYFVLSRGRTTVRLFAVAGLGLLAMGLMRSGSRGGFIALLAVAAFVLLALTTVPARSRVLGLVVILAVASVTASDQYWTQMQTLLRPNEDYNLTSDGGRMRIWGRGVGYMTDRPVLGVGLGNFQVAEGTISPFAQLQERGIGVRWGAAHNSFIQAGAELGVPGLIFFVALLLSVFRSLRRVARRALRANPPDPNLSRLAQTLMATMVGWVVGAFFLSLAFTDMLYTLVGLSLALGKAARST